MIGHPQALLRLLSECSMAMKKPQRGSHAPTPAARPAQLTRTAPASHARPRAARLEPIPSGSPGKASTAGPKSGVVVVGSLNMDLVFRTEVMPAPGETV